jgi:hypothetical protein
MLKYNPDVGGPVLHDSVRWNHQWSNHSTVVVPRLQSPSSNYAYVVKESEVWVAVLGGVAEGVLSEQFVLDAHTYTST